MAFAWVGALLIGLTLGLLGSGGSILTVPILVHGLGQPPKIAIAGSLLIVGCIAAAGALPRWRSGQLDGRSVLWFGLPGMAGAWLGASWSRAFDDTTQLALFAIVMLVAGVLMLRAITPMPRQTPRASHLIVADGLGVGILTGLVGVGGGFLILPALVLLGGLPMHTAIGTSLAIIALNAVSGFVRHLDLLAESGAALDWRVIAVFVAVGTVGSWTGSRIADRIPQARLKRVFGASLIVLAVAMLFRPVFTSLARG